jgi:hypothetical protein
VLWPSLTCDADKANRLTGTRCDFDRIGFVEKEYDVRHFVGMASSSTPS